MTTIQSGQADAVDQIQNEWRRLRPDEDLDVIGIVGRVLRASALIVRRSDEILARHGLTRVFPSAEVLARADLSGLPMPRARSASLSALAAAVAAPARVEEARREEQDDCGQAA